MTSPWLGDPKFALGLPPQQLGMTARDLVWLSELLRLHPEWSLFIELGTSWGITAALLGTAMRCRGGRLISVDLRSIPLPEILHGVSDFVEFIEGDAVPTDGGVLQPIAEAMQREPCIVLCDDGDKPEELRRYAPLLKPGDAIVVHDWREDGDASEITPRTTPAFLFEPPYEKLGWDLAADLCADLRGWLRT